GRSGQRSRRSIGYSVGDNWQARPSPEYVGPAQRDRVVISRARGTAMLTRRRLIALCAAPAFASTRFTRAARAQATKGDFPNKPVRLIVPVAAGGPTDIVARMLAEKLSKMWGQQVVVENKGGAGTNIGNEYVAQSDPDGYTILFATASLAVNTSLYRS